ncbi:MAG: hypothetical protein WCK11_05910 [Candidatus Falkowbacteria bacterium]
MLEKLFGSRTRVQLIKLFILSPQTSWTFLALVKKLKLNLATIKKELDNLEEFGMVAAEYVTKETTAPESAEIIDSKSPKLETGATEKPEKFYHLHPEFILQEELKALLIKSQLLYERDFVDKLKRLGKVKLLVLSGIFMNNTDSPVDLLVVGQVNKPKLIKLLSELEQEIGRELNFTYMDPAEFTYRRGMTDVFLYQVLEGKRLILVNELDV